MLEITCLAFAVYFEARSEPIAGQLAVANVIINRKLSPRYPNNICAVVFEGPVHASGHPIKNRCQFSFWCDGQTEVLDDRGAWNTALNVADSALTTRLDVSEGATHYHTTKVFPKWRLSLQQTIKIGEHIFYR